MGEITIDDPDAGNITLELSAEVTALLPLGKGDLFYDFKVIRGTQSAVAVSESTVAIIGAVMRATSEGLHHVT